MAKRKKEITYSSPAQKLQVEEVRLNLTESDDYKVFKAVIDNDADTLKHLLEKEKVNPDIKIKQDFVSELIKHIKSKSLVSGTPSLINKNRIDIEEIYFEANKAMKDDSKGITPLYLASMLGYDNIVQALIDNGVDVNSQTHGGNTPLIAAANANETQNVKVLLNANADKKVINEINWCALDYAVEHKNFELVKLLYYPGLDIEQAITYAHNIHPICDPCTYLDPDFRDIVNWLQEQETNNPTQAMGGINDSGENVA